ncbi:hypothetical protein ALC62_09606 [Cyphomyrmex costatus]|uniref:Peptidase A2 domain-containing protein n=1 Tax=Cyphomyrmex costatus TaxID=456900 RepID=A0A151IFF4_9HYME|nr:hypothetical protein ALC62_09606 [Cyphomyrmex costatus]
MLDTGAQPSIIKKGCLNDSIIINNDEILQLTGITKDVVNTLGSVKAHLYHNFVTFHVVPDNFPILSQGILGSSFFAEHDAHIDYRRKNISWHNCSFPFKEKESVVIPPRMNSGLTIRISNPEIKTGYLPRLLSYDGIYAGDTLVTCVNDKAYIKVLNTLEYGVEFLIPTLRLHEVAGISDRPGDSTKPPLVSNSLNNVTPVTRVLSKPSQGTMLEVNSSSISHKSSSINQDISAHNQPNRIDNLTHSASRREASNSTKSQTSIAIPVESFSCTNGASISNLPKSSNSSKSSNSFEFQIPVSRAEIKSTLLYEGSNSSPDAINNSLSVSVEILPEVQKDLNGTKPLAQLNHKQASLDQSNLPPALTVPESLILLNLLTLLNLLIRMNLKALSLVLKLKAHCLTKDLTLHRMPSIILSRYRWKSFLRFQRDLLFLLPLLVPYHWSR